MLDDSLFNSPSKEKLMIIDDAEEGRDESSLSRRPFLKIKNPINTQTKFDEDFKPNITLFNNHESPTLIQEGVMEPQTELLPKEISP